MGVCDNEHEVTTEWPRCPARALCWWVRLPLEDWMSVYHFSVFLLSCVGSGHA
jgi:hypothetical protein